MSSMLEQAIVDASALREAAMKSAEASVVEKYSAEVKEAVSKLLEQEDELGADPMAMGDDPMAMGTEETEVSKTTMEQVPMAHLPDVDEETFVEVNLDDILNAVKADEPSAEDAIEAEVDLEDVDLGIEDAEEAPGNRDDEVDISEEELVKVFKEMLVVDVPEIELKRSEDRANEAANHADEVETDEVPFSNARKKETIYFDGMDEDDLEEYERTMAKNESLTKDNAKLRSLLEQAKDKLQKVSLQNARLLYANRVLNDASLNEQQKNKIAELVGSARSVSEAKMVYETLLKTMASTSAKKRPQSLSEVVTRRSSVVLGGNRQDEEQTEQPSAYNRWAKLAGMTKD
jgi:hypothetical protein